MSSPALSLDCLTLTDSSPLEVIESAHRAGFDRVSLWVHDASYPRQAVDSSNASECARLLALHGIEVHSLEAVELASLDAVRSARPALEVGARLGGKCVLAYHYSNPDRAEVADALALLAESAAEFNLAVNVEPIAFGPTATVADANALIDAAGADVGIVFDTYHFIRSGGTVRELSGLDRSRIRYVQVNDGPLHRPAEEWFVEATQERLYPGEGKFPLAEILSLMPRDVPWGVEAPHLDCMRRGLAREDQAVQAISNMRAVMAQIDLQRN